MAPACPAVDYIAWNKALPATFKPSPAARLIIISGLPD